MSIFPFHFEHKYLDFDKYFSNKVDKTYSRIFNPSLVKLENDTYLYSARIRYQMKDPETKKKYLVPGNSPLCRKQIDTGANFWWNNWKRFGMDVTVFFIGNHQTNKYKMVKNIKIGKKGSQARYPYNLIQKNKLMSADVRLTSLNGKLYLYPNTLNFIFSLKYDKKNKSLEFWEIDIPTITNGINMSLIHLDKKIVWIDWFYKNEGVKFVSMYLDEKDPYRKKTFYIPFDRYRIDGEGSYLDGQNENIRTFGYNYGIMPKFSLGTPHIRYKISNNERLIIGVGHLKIHSDVDRYPYRKGSSIQKFRENLYNDMKNYYGSKYIRHFGSTEPPDCEGYIYLLYFYYLDPDFNEMKLSDGYLPLKLNGNKYKFSLIYPTGLERSEEKIIITAGEGDYYSTMVEFKIEQVLTMCRHSIKNMDMNNFRYYILTKYRSKTFISSSFEKIRLSVDKN